MLNSHNISYSGVRQSALSVLLTIIACFSCGASDFKDFIHTYTNTTTVQSVFVDKNGVAWAGTSHGLIHYDDLKYGHMIRYAMPEPLREPIHQIYGLNDGRMAIVTLSMKKYIFNPETYEVTEIDKDWLHSKGIDADGYWAISIIGNYNADALIETDGDIYLVDLASGGKARLLKNLGMPVEGLSADDKHYHIVTRTHTYSYEFATGHLQSVENPDDIFAAHVIMDNRGNIWFGDRNLYRFEVSSGLWRKLRDNVMVTEIARSGSDIYIGTNAEGILHYNDEGVAVAELHNNPFDINTPVSDHCAMIYVDHNDNLWVTYNKSDLSISSPYYNLTKVRHISALQQKLIKDDIISLLAIGDNIVLAGTDGNGLFAINPETGNQSTTTLLPNPSIPDAIITALYLDSNHRLWIGSYRTGLICVDKGRIRRFLPETSPYSIVEDFDGNIFIGTSGSGLYRIDSDLSNEPQKIDTGNETWIQKLAGNRSGTIYMASPTRITAIDSRTLNQTELIGPESRAQKSVPNAIASFYRDSRSLLWLISDDTSGCLRIFDEENDSLYSIPTLSEVRFRSAIEDDDKNMWFASDNDIYNIVPHYDPSTRSYSFRHYVYHIRSNESTPNKYNYRSVTKLTDGRLLFGGMNGYQVVDPAKYQKLGQMAKIKGTLSTLRVNNNYIIPNIPLNGDNVIEKELSHVDKITLRNNNNNLNFLFSPHDYDCPFKIEYYYRLDSTKEDWYPVEGNMIELMNLNPGHYHLEVCAMSPEGLMSGEVDGLDIEILSPWYLTLWAYIIYLILLLLILITVIYYFTDRQKQKLRVAQAEKEMDRQHQLNEMKLRFFTNISHDFRTPLSLIITPLETYLSKHDDTETSHFLKPVHKNAVHLLNLVNQILDFRKLDVTGVPLHLSYGDIVSYVKEVCASFNLFSEDSGIRLEINAEVETLNMYFDKDKVSKIMMNLLSNAFKYNEDGGTVIVTVKSEGDNVVISVADTGKGIPDPDKEHIFDRFYQSGKRQHATMGCGIGLHIVKEFVKLHNGHVEVKDNDPQGTVFTLTLPIVKTIEKDSEEMSANDIQGGNSQLVIPASENLKEGSKPSILLVEDNQDFIDFMEQALADEYNVLKASNGKEALEILQNETVDIVISDVMMDLMDGLELCHSIKSDIRISHIPVILLTAKSLAEDEMKGLESGADDYITKPFSMPILRQRISRLVDENRRSHEKFRRIPDIAPSEITITPLDEQFLSNTIKVVEENMSNPDFSVEMLSANLGMHRTHLYKKLSCITGKTPIEFIRLIRLKRAAQYLAQSQMYISEIAYKVGFNNPRLLTKYFKEEYNMTPREYVRSLGIDSGNQTEDQLHTP